MGNSCTCAGYDCQPHVLCDHPLYSRTGSEYDEDSPVTLGRLAVSSTPLVRHQIPCGPAGLERHGRAPPGLPGVGCRNAPSAHPCPSRNQSLATTSKAGLLAGASVGPRRPPWATAPRLAAIPEDTRSQPPECVYLNMYELAGGFERLNSVALDVLGFGAALHAGIEAFGEEWSYGLGGVSVSEPRNHSDYMYRQSITLGHTSLAREEVESIIQEMCREWPGEEYDIFSKNCCIFCREVGSRLGVGVPGWVTRLPETLAKVPGAQALARVVTETIRRGNSSPSNSPTIPVGGAGGGGASSSPLWGTVLEDDSPVPESLSPVSLRFSSSPVRGCQPLPRRRSEAFHIPYDGAGAPAIQDRFICAKVDSNAPPIAMPRLAAAGGG